MEKETKKEKHLITCQCRECHPEYPDYYPDIVMRKSDIKAFDRFIKLNK